MNILYFYRIYPCYGGVEVVTTVLANRFVKDGHNVTIVSIEQPNPELLGSLDPKVETRKLEYPVTSESNVKKLHAIVMDKDINIIINQWGLPYKTTQLCNRAIKGTKCKLISVLHGSPYTSKVIIKAQDKVKNSHNILSKLLFKGILFKKKQVIKASIRYDVRHNARYILLSKGFIQPLIDYAHVKDPQNILAIGNPITIPVDWNGFSLSNKKKQLLYVGRMDFENKRVNRIVEAWQELYKIYSDWELVLVGDGVYKKILEQYIVDHHIQRVCFEGFQKDPPIKYYKDASIFLLTSDLEGFGLVIIESMSYGAVPIVYGSYEAVYDIIRHDVSGYITPKPYNKENTVKYLRILMDNKEKREKMSHAAIKDASKFTVDSIIDRWYKVFNDVLKE